ncbi:MAG TPA: Gfo/Idh/MocA family oxidoreductase [Planctomycetota bacterium]|nr:Gfo/Idh/MocA family oxidoreductase [Planctomycetota bacterium]
MVAVGIIGLGFMGGVHAGAWKAAGATIVALADSDAAKLAAFAVDGTPARLADAKALIARPDVEVVDICLPTPLHLEAAKMALAAGKHVLCEKPLTRNSADAKALCDAARGAKGFLMPAQCVRFWPGWDWLLDGARSGKHGKLRSVMFQRVSSPPPGWFMNHELSGGALYDQHIHDTDLVVAMLGRPKSVTSVGFVGPSGGIDLVSTRYRYADDQIVVADGGWALDGAFGFRMRFTAVFERATADFDSSRAEPFQIFANGVKTTPKVETDGYHLMIKAFAECVAKKVKPPISPDESIDVIRVLEAEIASAKAGGVEKAIAYEGAARA